MGRNSPQKRHDARRAEALDFSNEGQRTSFWLKYGKRGSDVALSSLALVALSPVFVAIAAAVRFSGPGPVFYRQLRHGRDFELFEIIKFRTMSVCDRNGSLIRQTRRNDTRISRFGQFLRRTSLDELPQLFNVMAGDMSLVGPRPHAPYTVIDDTCFETLAMRPAYRSRYSVRPGITGIAQVSGCRGPMWTQQAAIRRLELDVEYVQQQSFLLDIKILARTILSEFVAGKAH